MDFQPPHPVQFSGNRLARGLLGMAGWQVDFAGLPARQGVLIVYPHTSNWDFVVGLLAKWSIGIPVRFWAKESLFRNPLFAAWLRRLGGMPISRASPKGAVGEMAALIAQKKTGGDYFWLALSPEGTRSFVKTWRSGFYRVALAAEVPVGIVALDYAGKRVVVRHFLRLTGNESRDMARIAEALAGSHGRRPALAAPIQLPQATPGPAPAAADAATMARAATSDH
ncbi:MAG: 1-acyl-sn-glycerol-3-phosphate acyltransferase [Polaromonas sp.]|nr:1-acyl-sn-glycerol-3-phosphate acyltransferase [Polaromonas sp.]